MGFESYTIPLEDFQDLKLTNFGIINKKSIPKKSKIFRGKIVSEVVKVSPSTNCAGIRLSNLLT